MHRHSQACFNSPRHRARRGLFGLSVVGLGVLALLDNLHVYDGTLLRTYWPLIFVVWGLAPLLWPRHPGSRIFGLLLMLVGALMTAHNLGHGSLSVQAWWPVFVILAGAAIVLRGLFPRTRNWGRMQFETSTLEHAEEIDVDATFSGIKLRNDSHAFKGGRVDMSFGGLELDLREAAMAEPEAVLQIRGKFSGIELRVPGDWLVVVQVTATMGAVHDKSIPPTAPKHRLVLRGETVFGAIEIKN